MFCFVFVCLNFTKLHLLMRLRWGPSPASCSASGSHFPACRHAFTPADKQIKQTKLSLQLIMLTWKIATSFERMTMLVTTLLQARRFQGLPKLKLLTERCSQSYGVNEATIIVNIRQNLKLEHSPTETVTASIRKCKLL